MGTKPNLACGNPACTTDHEFPPEDAYRSAAEREPCPACGSTARAHSLTLAATTTSKASMKLKGKTPGKKKPFFEWLGGTVPRGDGTGWVKKTWLIDRRNNRYAEHVDDEETGEPIKHVEERLTDHWGYGSDRARRADRPPVEPDENPG